MARATIGGRTRVGGWRRSCRRLLPALLALAILVPAPVQAGDPAVAWMSARQVHQARSTAIGEAAKGLADGSTAREIDGLRRMVALAVRELDALEVYECFRVWWSYVRSSYVLFDQALVGIQLGDLARVQAATSASRYLSAMAMSTKVECPHDGTPSSSGPPLGPRGGYPLVDAVGA